MDRLTDRGMQWHRVASMIALRVTYATILPPQPLQ